MCFGREKKEMKKIEAIANSIDALSSKYASFSNEQLRACTDRFKQRLKDGQTLNDILPEAFAVVREVSGRVLGMRHFKVQLMGGIILFQGRIAEMKTGEGKTLVATLPAYLYALTGKGVHIVTVNEYLAQRDSLWMGKIYQFLGLTVGVILNSQSSDEKREIYKKDIIYSTSSNLGFDYLRDNLCVNASAIMQRELNFALIDEVDSILIDEARTPLIISGPSGKPADQYRIANQFVKSLEYIKPDDDLKEDEEVPGDVELDEKEREVSLTDQGVEKAEAFYKLEKGHLGYVENMELFDYINTALRARFLMLNNRDYIKKDGKIYIVDSNTGRIMEGRRFSKGLHQAIEAKEGCVIQDENRTIATITIQNFFRLYSGLAGMTGTAKTEEEEFSQIYGLNVLVVPTNKPIKRQDLNDVVYGDEKNKFQAVIQDVKDCYKRGQPVLVGAASVEKSEILDKLFTKAGIPHTVLNAKNHEKEAEIVAQAGRFGAVTIATNMAGRGTDILLGGNPESFAKLNLKKFYRYSDEQIAAATALFVSDQDQETMQIREQYNALLEEEKKKSEAEKLRVIEQGGLRIIGTERNDSRRVDNQLRGRAGRQGDVGSSVFYVSLEDEMIRHFGGDRLRLLGSMLNDSAIDSKLVTKAIERAQKISESRHFAVRKNVLNYDDVTNEQRKIIYAERNRILAGEDMHEEIKEMISPVAKEIINDTLPLLYRGKTPEEKEEGYKDFINAALKSIIIPEIKNVVDVTPDEPDYEPELRRIIFKMPYDKEEMLQTQPTELLSDLVQKGIDNLELKRKEFEEYKDKLLSGSDTLKNINISYTDVERTFLLKSIDKYWIDHLDGVEELKDGIGLRAVAGQDPLMAFKRESRELFDETMQKIRKDVVRLLIQTDAKNKLVYYSNFSAELRRNSEFREALFGQINQKKAVKKPQTVVNTTPKVGRNDPCPCGSGKKYKNCCGAGK